MKCDHKSMMYTPDMMRGTCQLCGAVWKRRRDVVPDDRGTWTDKTYRFQFSNVVVVDDNQIGVIVKTWADDMYEVYVRSTNSAVLYPESAIKHFVYDKELREV